jgi:UDP-glucose 4-epimerase
MRNGISRERALVTGGAGFIGSHLTERLLAEGHEVVVLDDLSTGRLENLSDVAGHPRLAIHVGSVHDASLLGVLVDATDTVYHLAASVGVRRILDAPIEAMENNLLGTSAVLRAAAASGAKVVVASSSEVYGKRSSGASREDDDTVFGPTVKTRWSYACCKAIDEFLALAYCRDRGVPVVIVRYFNVVGPRQRARYGMVIPRFVRQALAGAPITVYGDGRQTRSFTDCADAVACTYALSRHPDAVGGVFNVGNDDEIMISDLAGRVKALAGSTSPVAFVPYDEAYGDGYEDLPRRIADISKARAVVGYTPEVDLDQTIESVIAYERARANRRSRRCWLTGVSV